MIEIISGYDRIEEVKALFSEYTEMLVSLDPSCQVYKKLHLKSAVCSVTGKLNPCFMGWKKKPSADN